MDLGAAGELGRGEGLALGIVVAVFLAGLRHGFDIDHVAAIGDITSSQSDRKRSLVLATMYALGHMIVVFVLGAIAVLAGRSIPSSVDAFVGRLIGVTLIVLGIYVVWTLVRFGAGFRMRSRWMLALDGVRRIVHWLKPSKKVVIEHAHHHDHAGHHNESHNHGPSDLTGAGGPGTLATMTKTHVHTHRHVVPAPVDPFTEYGIKTSFFVGMIHGVGAETPTQVLLFTTAAGVAGTIGGVVLLAAFVIGLLIGNTVLALVASAGFAAGRRVPWLYRGLGAVSAVTSISVGLAYAVDRPELLPWFFGS